VDLLVLDPRPLPGPGPGDGVPLDLDLLVRQLHRTTDVLRLDVLLDVDLSRRDLPLPDRELLLGARHSGLTAELPALRLGTPTARALEPLTQRRLVLRRDAFEPVRREPRDLVGPEPFDDDLVPVLVQTGVSDRDQDVPVLVDPEAVLVQVHVQVTDFHRRGVDEELVHRADLLAI